jgi:hypothetical protein
VARERISTIAGEGCVQSFVEAAERDLELETDLGEDNGLPLAVGQAGRQYHVTGFKEAFQNGTARLFVSPGWLETLGTSTPSVTLADLHRRGPLRRIEVDYGSGQISTIAKVAPSPGPSGATECLILTPTAVPLQIPAP